MTPDLASFVPIAEKPIPRDDGGAAFPGIQGMVGCSYATPMTTPNGRSEWVIRNQGISLRNYFAIHILQGMAASEYWSENFNGGQPNLALDSAVKVAYLAADTMIKESKL